MVSAINDRRLNPRKKKRAFKKRSNLETKLRFPVINLQLDNNKSWGRNYHIKMTELIEES